MTVTSSPSGEHAGRPGANWDTVLVTHEVIVDLDDGESPFGWRELDTTTPGMNEPLPPRPNRATRRAMQRAARRTT